MEHSLGMKLKICFYMRPYRVQDNLFSLSKHLNKEELESAFIHFLSWDCDGSVDVGAPLAT